MNKKTNLNTIKAIILVVAAFCMAIAGYLFREHRTFKEAVVVSEGCTEVKRLSDYRLPSSPAPSMTAMFTFMTAAYPAALSWFSAVPTPKSLLAPPLLL